MPAAAAAPKSHVIVFGKWISVQWFPGTGDNQPLPLKVRALLVDARLKEYVLGQPHEVTERLFVVRRAFRINDSLNEETGTPRWQWQRGGWLLVDRTTGRIAPVNLPEFDALYSASSWYRDYVAYCGVSDDGKTIYAMVAQLNRRKPVLKKALSSNGIPEDTPPDSACAAPAWQRTPTRITFDPPAGTKQTFSIRGRAADVVLEPDESEEGDK